MFNIAKPRVLQTSPARPPASAYRAETSLRSAQPHNRGSGYRREFRNILSSAVAPEAIAVATYNSSSTRHHRPSALKTGRR